MKNYTNQEVLEIAKWQKALLWIILLLLLSYFLLGLKGIGPLIGLVIAVVEIIFVYQLAMSLKESAAWLYAILMIIPFVSLIVLLMLSSRATAALRSRGVRVGLMGANGSDLDKLRLS